MSVQEFLDSVNNRFTKKEYRYGIKKFCEWFDRTPEEILELRKDDLTQRPDENLIEYKTRAARFEKQIEKFHSHLLEQGYSINTSRNLTIGIRQLFRFYQMPIRMRAGSRVTKTVRTSKSFPLRIEHVREMFEVADLRERVILSLGTDLGLRVGDFIRIKKKDLPSLDQEAPIAFDIMTGKEDVVAHGFLSQETVDLLRTYLPVLDQKKKDNPYLYASNGLSHISDEWLNRLLQRLSEKAQIEIPHGKKLTFHCFRKMFLSATIDSGIGLTAGKMLVGKSIAIHDETYLTTVRLREKFLQLKKFLTIKPSAKPEEREKVEELKGIVVTLQEELNRQWTVTQTVTEENLKIKKELHTLNEILNPLQPMLEFAGSFKSPRAMLEFLRAIKERSETAKQRAEPMSPLVKKAKALFSEALSEVLERDSEKLRQILSQEINIEDDAILQRAIQAAKDSIKEDYGMEI